MRTLTPAHAAHLERKRRARAIVESAAVPCDCTDPVRLRHGKRTNVWVGDRRMALCVGCLLDRDGNSNWWYSRNGQNDLDRRRAERHAHGAIAEDIGDAIEARKRAAEEDFG